MSAARRCTLRVAARVSAARVIPTGPWKPLPSSFRPQVGARPASILMSLEGTINPMKIYPAYWDLKRQPIEEQIGAGGGVPADPDLIDELAVDLQDLADTLNAVKARNSTN